MDLELFKQDGYTNDIPTGSQLNDRIAAAQTGSNPKNITWSKIITWFNSALSFVKLDWSNFNTSYSSIARTKLSVQSTAEADAKYATLTGLSQLDYKRGGLVAKIVGAVNSNGTKAASLFATTSWNVSKQGSGHYRIFHNLNTGATFCIASAISEGNEDVGFTSTAYVDANTQDFFFGNDSSLDDTPFKFIIYQIDGW